MHLVTFEPCFGLLSTQFSEGFKIFSEILNLVKYLAWKHPAFYTVFRSAWLGQTFLPLCSWLYRDFVNNINMIYSTPAIWVQGRLTQTWLGTSFAIPAQTEDTEQAVLCSVFTFTRLFWSFDIWLERFSLLELDTFITFSLWLWISNIHCKVAWVKSIH